MKNGTYQLLDWEPAGGSISVETDDGQLLITRADAAQHKVALMVDDCHKKVEVSDNCVTIVSHQGDISSMRFGLGLPE